MRGNAKHRAAVAHTGLVSAPSQSARAAEGGGVHPYRPGGARGGEAAMRAGRHPDGRLAVVREPSTRNNDFSAYAGPLVPTVGPPTYNSALAEERRGHGWVAGTGAPSNSPSRTVAPRV